MLPASFIFKINLAGHVKQLDFLFIFEINLARNVKQLDFELGTSDINHQALCHLL